MTGEKIKAIGRSSIQIGSAIHPVSYENPFVPNNEYIIHDYKFLDELGITKNGCIFEINPGGSTRVMQITDDKLTCQRVAVKGSGWLLRVSPESNQVECIELNEEESLVVELKKGWVDCCIAGKKGIQVADISTPSFKSDMEKEIPIDSKDLPPEFWEQYHHLKNKVAEEVNFISSSIYN